MSPLLVAAAGLGLVLLVRRATGPRPLRQADAKRLRQLYLTKLYIERDIKLCAAKVAHEEKRFTGADLVGTLAGLAAVAAGGEFKTVMATARAARTVGTAAGWGHKDIQQLCPGVRERVAGYAKTNDELSAAFGLDPNMGYKELAQLVVVENGIKWN